jgi:cytochrome c
MTLERPALRLGARLWLQGLWPPLRLASTLLLTLATAPWAQTATPAVNEAAPDARYKIDTLIEDIPQPMQLDVAPDGRIFFIEIGGAVKIYHPDTKQVTLAGQVPVIGGNENGMLGMVLDPQFAANGWIYLLYSPPDFTGQRISRFTIMGNTLSQGTRKDLLTYAEQRKECCHHAGALRFGQDGCLYASSGDNTNPFASDAYAPLDDRPARDPWDSQKSAGNTNDLRGKILRIKPKADGTYDIPPGNLFKPGLANTRPEIYAMGFRNPWRFNIDHKTGIVYVGDVGPDAGGENAQRGPAGYDTINQIRKPGNFGWPYSRGGQAYSAYNFESKQSGAKFDLLKPLNLSANNTGLKELPPVVLPMIWYPYGESKEFPALGGGGRVACGGPVYHFDPKLKTTGCFPDTYDNCLLIYDWERPFIKWVRLDKDSRMLGIEPFISSVRVAYKTPDDGSGHFQIRRPEDMQFGPDGALYLFDYGSTWGANKDSKLVRISYQWGIVAPIAKASAKNAAGHEPLTVELSAEGSKSMEGGSLKYEWRLQPGDKVISKTASAKVTIAELGNYQAVLQVTDAKGGVASASVALAVGNTPPVVRFESPQNGDFFAPGQPITYKVAVSDAEDGDSAASVAKGDEMGFRTLVSASWKTSDGKVSETEPGLALMKASDCFNCHAVEQQLIGPPLIKVADKYRGVAGAEDESVGRVLKGSTGVWGQVGMLPHASHSQDELHLMVRWIYSLEAGKPSPGMARGISGTIVAPKDDQATACTLSASYTDAGRPPVGAITSSATVVLRARRLEAKLADEIHGPKITAFRVGGIEDKHWLKYTGLNLGDTAGITMRAASEGEGGKVEIHASAPTGDLIGTVELANSGAKYAEATAMITVPKQARGDVYLVFLRGATTSMSLEWVQFNPH